MQSVEFLNPMNKYVILAISTNAYTAVQSIQVASPSSHSGNPSVGSIGNLPWNISISILKYSSKYERLNSIT
jgi:hypothetical protein